MIFCLWCYIVMDAWIRQTIRIYSCTCFLSSFHQARLYISWCLLFFLNKRQCQCLFVETLEFIFHSILLQRILPLIGHCEETTLLYFFELFICFSNWCQMEPERGLPWHLPSSPWTPIPINEWDTLIVVGFFVKLHCYTWEQSVPNTLTDLGENKVKRFHYKISCLFFF